MASASSLVQFVHRLARGHFGDVVDGADDDDDDAAGLSPSSILAAIAVLNGRDLGRDGCGLTDRERMKLAQDRLTTMITMKDPDEAAILSMDDLARGLVVVGCRGNMKEKVISMILSMPEHDQHELMSVVKNTELQHLIKADNPDRISDDVDVHPGRDDFELERIKLAEQEASAWKSICERSVHRAQSDLAVRNDECKRLSATIASLHDEIDVLRERNEIIPVLQSDLARLESALDAARSQPTATVDLPLIAAPPKPVVVVTKLAPSPSADEIDRLSTEMARLGGQRDALAKENSRLIGDIDRLTADLRLADRRSKAAASPSPTVAVEQRSVLAEIQSTGETDRERTVRQAADRRLADLTQRLADLHIENESLREMMANRSTSIGGDVSLLIKEKQGELDRALQENWSDHVSARQERALMSSAMHNLAIEFQRRFLNAPAPASIATKSSSSSARSQTVRSRRSGGAQ